MIVESLVGLALDVEDMLMPWSAALTGACGWLAIDWHRRGAYLRAEIATYLAGIGVLPLPLFGFDPEAAWQDVFVWTVDFIVGLLIVWLWFRYGVQLIDGIKAKLTLKSSLARRGRTDVRDLAAVLPPERGEYDGRPYYRAEEFFLGLGEEGQPIYWQGRLPHVSVVGTTGSGKGRKLQDMAAQGIRMGEAVIYLDPKNDEWGPHALYAACLAAGRHYHFVSLIPSASAQFNILEGAEVWQIDELLSATLDLGDKGRGSDYYAAKNRAAARAAAQLAFDGSLTLAEVHRQMAGDEHWQEEAPGFLDKLGELAGLPAINGKGGALSLPQLIDEGGGLYIVGSMVLQPVRRAQQMIFVRVQQIASARDRMNGALRTVCVIADETKYHISRPVLQGLGASRDKGMRVVLAYQSFNDLRDCPADMSPDAVVGAVIENTPLKLIYKIEDPDTAEWAARRSGKILVDAETRVMDRNAALSETTQAGRVLSEGEAYLIDTNRLQNLTAGWGVIFGQGLAKLCYVSPYRVGKAMAAITPISVPATAAPPARHNDLSAARGGRSRDKVNHRSDFFDLESSHG